MPERSRYFLVYEIDDTKKPAELPFALACSWEYRNHLHAIVFGNFLLIRISDAEAETYKAFKLYLEIELEDLADVVDVPFGKLTRR